MSYTKVNNPQLIKDYLVRKKLVRDRLLSERTGDIELQQDLSKFFRPITKSQRETQEEATKKIAATQLATSRPIIAGLEPIREGVQQLPGAFTEGLAPIREGIIKLPVQLSREMMTRQLPMEAPPSYHKITAEENEEEIKNFVKVFDEKSEKYKVNFDNNYRIVFDSDLEKFKLGKKVISYNVDDIFFSLWLWELILSKNPKNYTKRDLNAYQNMIYQSDIIFKDNDRTNDLKFYKSDEKWEKIIKPVFDYILKQRQSTGKGLRKKKTTTVIPSDPNALIERLDLLMASKNAGNTGVKNELVSICDELKRQRVLNAKSYKKLIALL